MVKFTVHLFFLGLIVLAIASCKKPYEPPVITSPYSYLVVDGVINTGADSTFIMLSRTTNLADSVKRSGEKGATVELITNGGATYPFTEVRNGVYAHEGLNLDVSKTYKLSIATNGQHYLSDDIIVKVTPPIDNVGFKPDNNTLQINVSTHDPSNNTKYYKWDYDDAWRFTTQYRSGYIYDETLKNLRGRTIAEDIYTCYSTGVSSTVNIGTTVKLAQDVVSDQVIETIPSSSVKLNSRYSILVKQYALTKEAYTFWENLKKNTEQLGSVFDPLPSEIGGNIHNVDNPAEPVVGYISASNIQTKRIYINKIQLPSWPTPYPSMCNLDSTLRSRPFVGDEVKLFLYPPTSFLAISAIESEGNIIGYMRTFQDCADCRLYGKKKAPAFWIDN